jgi:hypothetical protein
MRKPLHAPLDHRRFRIRRAARRPSAFSECRKVLEQQESAIGSGQNPVTLADAGAMAPPPRLFQAQVEPQICRIA